jgi:[acyl-carrier-protein] S-malonyltransferase
MPDVVKNHTAAACVLQELVGKKQFEFAMGLNIGEVTALAIAGVLNVKTSGNSAQGRRKFIQDACMGTDSGMVSILGATFDSGRKLCDLRGVQMSSVNGSGQIVLSREKQKIWYAMEVTGGKTMTVAVAVAFLRGIQFTKLLQGICFQVPRTKVVSKVTGEVISNPERMNKLLIQQIISRCGGGIV